MKTEAEVREYFETWCESVREEPMHDDFRAGLSVGYLLALSTVLDDAKAKAKAREAIAEIRSGR